MVLMRDTMGSWMSLETHHCGRREALRAIAGMVKIIDEIPCWMVVVSLVVVVLRREEVPPPRLWQPSDIQ